MTSLPTNIDLTYDDTGDPSRKQHQQHHDSIHAALNALPADPLSTATANATYAPQVSPVFSGTFSFGGTGATVRNPFLVSTELDASIVGTSGADVVGVSENVTVSGDFTAMGGPSPGQVFGRNAFVAVEDCDGIATLYGSLSEVAVTATGGTTITNVIGAASEAAFYGAAAGAHIGTMTSHRVNAPKRKDGATGGTTDLAISAYFEKPTIGTANYSAVFAGEAVFQDRVQVQSQIVSSAGTLNLAADFSSTASIILQKASDGGNSSYRLGAASSIHHFQDGDGATIFYAEKYGLHLRDGLPLELGTTSGTKIGTTGTQKLGFYGATPVVQPAHPTTLADVITALQVLGLVA